MTLLLNDDGLVERLREDDEMLCDGLQLQALTEAWHNVAMKNAAKDCAAAADAITRLRAERDGLRDLADRLKLEAQSHAGEARTANSTIYEIYQVLSGATGEPGNWNGAKPARQYVAAAERALIQAEARGAERMKERAAAECDKHAVEPDPDEADPYDEYEMGCRGTARRLATAIRKLEAKDAG